MIKFKLRKLANDFNLKFKEKWFKHIWVSKEENILLEFLWMCPDPIFMKYGKNYFERAKQIEILLASSEFKNDLLKRFGGQVIEKKAFMHHFPKTIKEIENSEIKKLCELLYKKIINSLKDYSRIAVLTKSSKKDEKESLETFVLFHEWIHILLDENNLAPNNWKYNEGLVTYLESFSEDKLNKLEEGVKKWKHYPFQREYYIYAMKFRKLLKEVINPSERQIKIKEFLNKK